MSSEDTSIGDILVVDDNAANLTAIEAALDDLSGRVVRAQSGNDALRVLLERDFALILLDVKMPSMDGFETARLIRARRRSSYTPIVFMTAYGHDDTDVLSAYELGAVDFLFKPIRPEVLRAKAGVFVELRQRTLEVARQAAQIREHERREHERSLQAEREHWEAEALRRQMEHLARADAYKDRFLAVLSHELRNPLSSIVAGLEVLRERLVDEAPVDATMRRTRDIVERQAKHLTRLVDDLLDITRISSGKVPLRKQDVLLGEIVEQAVDTTQPLVKEREQELVVELPSEPIVLHGDSIRLVQVIANLLHNASRYTQAKGRIVLACTRNKDAVEIRVSDNGRGIGKDFLPHVFEAFSQEATHTGAGLGVGLSVVRQLVSLHQGTVAVHSDGHGLGCEFTVRLPIVVGGEAAKHEHSAPPPLTRPAARPLSIVLIDDSEDVREMMAELLRGWGHRVQVAPDGESGSELALRARPDIAFIDIGLPKLDGYGVAEALRSHRELKTRLIAMTGSGQESDRRRAFDAGFDAHLVKPASIEALHAVLSFEERDATRSTPSTH